MTLHEKGLRREPPFEAPPLPSTLKASLPLPFEAPSLPPPPSREKGVWTLPANAAGSAGHGDRPDGHNSDGSLTTLSRSLTLTCSPSLSCFVCGRAPRSRRVLQCCSIPVHLQCITGFGARISSTFSTCAAFTMRKLLQASAWSFLALNPWHPSVCLVAVSAFTTSAWLGQSILAVTAALSAHRTSSPTSSNTSIFPSTSTRPPPVNSAVNSLSVP